MDMQLCMPRGSQWSRLQYLWPGYYADHMFGNAVVATAGRTYNTPGIKCKYFASKWHWIASIALSVKVAHSAAIWEFTASGKCNFHHWCNFCIRPEHKSEPATRIFPIPIPIAIAIPIPMPIPIRVNCLSGIIGSHWMVSGCCSYLDWYSDLCPGLRWNETGN